MTASASPTSAAPVGAGAWVYPANLRRGRDTRRSRPPSWPRSRPPRCSWWTTARPTEPERSPTRSPPRTRGSASSTGQPRPAWVGPTSPGSGRPSTAARPTCSRWTPTGPATPDATPGLLAPLEAGTADLVIGSRYTEGGRVVNWGVGRRLVSRGGSLFAPDRARPPGRRPHRRLQGMAGVHPLPSVDFAGVHAGGYVFQVEMTYRAQRGGARVREVPITFRDRRVGQSEDRPQVASRRSWWSCSFAGTSCGDASRGPHHEARRGGRATLPPDAVRVAVDVRSLQDAGRAPVTAAYLRGLLGAYAAEPLPGESFVLLLDLGADDPSSDFPGLPVIGKRRLPITRLFRSGALTLDPFLVRGAALGSGRGAGRRAGTAPVVAHAVGGALPIGPGLPVVATLLDLAPWELPDQYQRSPAARIRPAPSGAAPAPGRRRHRRNHGCRPLDRTAPADPPVEAARRAPGGRRCLRPLLDGGDGSRRRPAGGTGR